MAMWRVAVIGAGPRGRAFAFRCAQAGFAVVLEDVMPSNLRRAQDEYAELTLGGLVEFASTVEDAVHAADVVVDFVPDELESKLEIVSMIDRMAPPRTVIATPTDALSITDLASCTYRAERCVGLRKGMTEIVRGRATDVQVVEDVVAWLKRVGMDVRVVEDAVDPMLVKNVC